LSCKVATDDTGAANRGYAFVHFETEEAANKAIETVNGKLLAGKKCYVAKFVPAKERNKELATKAPKWTNIFVKNMPRNMTESRFEEIFGRFGHITSFILKFKKNEVKGEEKAFGFVNYETHEQAAKAVEEMNGKEIDDSQLFVGRAQKKQEREKELKSMFEKLKRDRMSKYQGVNLFVKNLDESIDDEKLRQEFAHCGTITSAKVMHDEKNASKGFGFVCFNTPEEATKAVTEMNGKMIASKPIYVAIAERKEQRRAKLEQQYHQRAATLRSMPPGSIPGAPVYPQPIFYGRGGAFVYPPTMMPRGRFPSRGGFQGQPTPMPGNYMVGPGNVPPATRGTGMPGGRGRGRGGNMSGAPGQMALKYNPNVRNPQAQQQQQAITATPGADPKQVVGEKLFHAIMERVNPQQQNLVGKITGMILESLSVGELSSLLENPPLLGQKIQEALQVLGKA
jgi:polyadenylate-binding protein